MAPQGIEIGEDYVTISDEFGEIVHWVSDEWNEDETVTIAIAKAIHIYHTEGPKRIREIIGKEV